jgi:superoxide dismutase, Fe-Mn family
METFTLKTFNLGELDGISKKTIEEHLKLYKGYVANSNTIFNKLSEMKNDVDKNSYALAELQRRFGFEFGGMRNHEYYFESLSGGKKEINKEGKLYKKIVKDWGSYEAFLENFKFIAMTRGIGWAMLYFDKINNKLIMNWVDEQHIGHLAGLPLILALDMWEHSYYLDYIPAEKKNYIEAFFNNLNWGSVENNYELSTLNS